MRKKRLFWQLMAGGFIMVPLLVAAHTVHAAITTKATSDSSVNGALKSFGQRVEIRGTVNGDIMCAGQDVHIDAKVTGDVICAGQNVTVDGTVDGDIRVAGQNVRVSADITRAATAVGQYVAFESDSSVGTDVVTMASKTVLEGEIKRDVHVKGAGAEISGAIGRDVQFEGGKLSIASGAMVTGNVEYKSPQTVAIADSANVEGEVTYTKTSAQKDSSGVLVVFESAGFWVAFAVGLVLAAVLFGLVLAWLFPRHLTETATLGGRRFGMAILVGLLASLAWPFAMGLTAVTVVGLPITAFLWAFGTLVVMFGWAATGLWLGGAILRKSGLFARVSLGMFLLTILVIIPVVGWIVGLVAFWFGTGMVVLQIWQRRTSFNHTIAPSSDAGRGKTRAEA